MPECLVFLNSVHLMLQVLLAAVKTSGNSGDIREGDDGEDKDD
jgi:hypothetical protein